MKLLGSLTSPFVRKVRIVMAEKRIDYDFQVTNPWAEDSPVPGLNPLGKVPVLVLDEGTPLYDSRVVVDYLDTLTPVSRLIPDGNRARLMVKRWEALADGVCEAAANVFLERKRPARNQSEEWIARQQGKVAAGVGAMARDLGERNWCHGENLTLADLAVGCALGYLDFRFPDVGWRDHYPLLAKLYEKLAARPSFKTTVPKG